MTNPDLVPGRPRLDGALTGLAVVFRHATARRDEHNCPCHWGSAAELKRLAPGGHIRLRFNAPEEFASAALVLPAASRDDESLVLQVPNDGSVQSLRALLARIDDAALQVDELTVHTPDLDDVFFALTKETVR